MTHAAGGAPANEIRTQYGAVARRVLAGGASATATACCDASASVVEAAPSSAASACGGTVSCCGAALDGATDPITADLYVSGESDELPAAAILASLGCGNPTALAELR
ncbi:MAG: hypothetical protein MUF21_15290, partial [Gemmatimonadaceae bacterium]|nr:hypothetical protein [Gemmatimonadaceae bacterium]